MKSAQKNCRPWLHTRGAADLIEVSKTSFIKNDDAGLFEIVKAQFKN